MQENVSSHLDHFDLNGNQSDGDVRKGYILGVVGE